MASREASIDSSHTPIYLKHILRVLGLLLQINLNADLLILYLDDNSLTGLIPALPVSLVDLRLRMNMLSGEIPTEIGDLVVLQTCYLDSNLLAGEIPTAFERNVLLQDLHLYNNRLSGGIPSSFGRLEKYAYSVS